MGKPKKQAALELDLNTYELRRAGRVIPLERQPMELLILLADRHGQLVTRDVLNNLGNLLPAQS
jgi:DNA-binding response OmpR family regulator